ncbi:oxysterol-binding protein-related protein 8 isoform 1, partial [Danaus plexippus plexippus]
MDKEVVLTRRRSSIFSLLKRQKKLSRQLSEPVQARKYSVDSALKVDRRLEALALTNDELAGAASDTDSEDPGMQDNQVRDEVVRKQDILERINSLYVEDPDREIGVAGELVEEVAEENKSLLWFLLKQVRPGMDLSKVVLPTFILEPRSFLDKLSDNYYHADLLMSAFYVSNRKDGFVIEGSLLARSKFY